MKKEHTPGPWRASKSAAGYIAIYHGRNVVAQLGSFHGNDESATTTHCRNAKANARLIASAPELLEALTGMLEWARRVKGSNPGPEIRNAHAAIAKATGQQ